MVHCDNGNKKFFIDPKNKKKNGSLKYFEPNMKDRFERLKKKKT
jgi:hypothetical protein